MEHERKVIAILEKGGDIWRVRAIKAEGWWLKASPLLAEIGRMYQLDEKHMTDLRELMKWEPE